MIRSLLENPSVLLSLVVGSIMGIAMSPIAGVIGAGVAFVLIKFGTATY